MRRHTPSPSNIQALPIDHPENFPVASWLCPPRLRPAIAAIYAFARAADDIADEGHATPNQRLIQLQAFRDELQKSANASGHRSDIFGPLHQVIETYQLPTNLLDNLLSAFEQDVQATASAHRYEDVEMLLRYCKLSANPVGRLLLHLYEVQDPTALQQSDAICSALQLINFWQDLSEDIPRGRFYLPTKLEAAMNVSDVLKHLCEHALQLMNSGAPLVHRVPGRAGWELRLMVQGGLRILEKVKALGPRAMNTRPRLRIWDIPLMFWRALWM
jgi:squalene synthase HpnC